MEAILTDADLLRILHVSPSTLYRYRTRRRNALPAHKLGARVYFFEGEVMAWLRRQPAPVRLPRTRR